MWLDDEGDEGEGPGDLPDPSTRHWRHPSELGQHRALPHPDPTPLGPGPNGGGSATVWPLVAVGGCLAIAALGVIGLRTDLGGTGSLQAGTAATVVPTQTTSRTAAASAAAEGAAGVDVGPPTIERSRPTPGDDDLSARPSPSGPTTTLAATDDAKGANPRSPDGPATRSTDLLDAPSLGEVARVPVYGVYAAPGRDESQLGSFIMVGGDPIASWSSLDERATVWLRVETQWLEATVVAEDPITDVALLNVLDETNGVVMPTMTLADGPIELGAPAMVGYGDLDSLADDASEDGPEWDETVPRTAADPESEDDPDDEDEDEDGDIRAWVRASDRRGLIYSLTKPLTTGSDRLIHDPIRLHTVPGPTDAGAPLRNRDGEIIGMVAHSTLPQVAAVPIQRVVEVVAWLRQTGVGDPAWLGLTVSPTPGGLVVTTIDQGSPGVALAPGDLIVAVDRQLVFHPDSLEFAAREAGPGQVLDLVVDRKNRRQIIQLQVGTRPLP